MCKGLINNNEKVHSIVHYIGPKISIQTQFFLYSFLTHYFYNIVDELYKMHRWERSVVYWSPASPHVCFTLDLLNPLCMHKSVFVISDSRPSCGIEQCLSLHRLLCLGQPFKFLPLQITAVLCYIVRRSPSSVTYSKNLCYIVSKNT